MCESVLSGFVWIVMPNKLGICSCASAIDQKKTRVKCAKRDIHIYANSREWRATERTNCKKVNMLFGLEAYWLFNWCVCHKWNRRWLMISNIYARWCCGRGVCCVWSESVKCIDICEKVFIQAHSDSNDALLINFTSCALEMCASTKFNSSKRRNGEQFTTI